MLEEETPFAILRSQFLKNTSTNFILVDGKYAWNTVNPQLQLMSIIQNYRPNDNLPDSLLRSIYTRPVRYTSIPLRYTVENKQPIRFSLLNENFELQSDSVFTNNKNAFTLQPEKVSGFSAFGKNYLVLGQRFFKRSNGLLLVSEVDNKLMFTDIMVNSRNDYLLSEAKPVARGLVVPYTHKREAGLLKIMIE